MAQGLPCRPVDVAQALVQALVLVPALDLAKAMAGQAAVQLRQTSSLTIPSGPCRASHAAQQQAALLCLHRQARSCLQRLYRAATVLAAEQDLSRGLRMGREAQQLRVRPSQRRRRLRALQQRQSNGRHASLQRLRCSLAQKLKLLQAQRHRHHQVE